MKLYYTKGACSLAVRILINELKLKCDYESVNLKNKVTETGKDFLSVNPKGAVPTLMLDTEEILTENAVIHQYLVETHRNNELLPAIGDIKRYHVLESLNYITTELHKGFGPLFIPDFPEVAKKDFIVPALMKKLKYVDSILGKNSYFCGDHYTLPDGYLFVMLQWAKGIFKMDLSSFSNLRRYFDHLKQRPSVKTSLTQEGLE